MDAVVAESALRLLLPARCCRDRALRLSARAGIRRCLNVLRAARRQARMRDELAMRALAFPDVYGEYA